LNTEQFLSALEGLGIRLDSDQLALFDRYEEGLYIANEVMNLTRVPRPDCRQRHFVDSLLFQDLIHDGASVLDIGTGPGFPAWPLACARPDLSVTALDSNGKMLGFLKTQPLPNLRVVNHRAEEWQEREGFDVVTGRAVAPLSAQLEISAGFCRIGGLVVPMRSPSDIVAIQEINLKPLGLSYSRLAIRTLPGSDVERVFPVYSKVKPTAQGYPRRWAELKKKPL
jgi:16S rRNA (guanine527-N7)-methyltransferase